jgi:hypothetical protein
MNESNREYPPIHITDPRFWVDKNGNQLGPLTVITLENFESGDVVISPDAPKLTGRSMDDLMEMVWDVLSKPDPESQVWSKGPDEE